MAHKNVPLFQVVHQLVPSKQLNFAMVVLATLARVLKKQLHLLTTKSGQTLLVSMPKTNALLIAP